MASSFTKFLDHTQRRTTVGRIPLDEWSARRRDLYMTNTQHSQGKDIHTSGGIQTHNLSRRAAANPRNRQLAHWDRRIGSFMHHIPKPSRPQRPRVSRRESAAARLLVLRVRIPPGTWMFCLLWVLCLVRLRSLRGAYHFSREVLQSAVCRCVCVCEVAIMRRPQATKSLLGHETIPNPNIWICPSDSAPQGKWLKSPFIFHPPLTKSGLSSTMMMMMINHKEG